MGSVALAVFGIAFLVMFRKRIDEILSNIGNNKSKLQYKGLGFNIELGSNTEVSSNQQGQNKLFEFSKAYQSNIVTNEERIIKNQLAEASLTYEQAIGVTRLNNVRKFYFLSLLS